MITDYASLKDVLLGNSGYTHRTDLNGVIDTFVQSATSRINREVKANAMEKSAVLVSSTKDFTLPSDYNQMRVVFTDDDEFVSPVTPGQTKDENWSREAFYSIHGGTLELRPAPTQSTNLNLKYYANLAVLSADTDTNQLLTDFPNLYIYAVMIEFCLFTEEDERVATWQSAFTEEAMKVNKIEEMSRHGPGLSIRTY